MSRSFRPQLTLLIGLIALAVVAALAYLLGGSTAPAWRVVWIVGAVVTAAAMLTSWFAAGRVGRTLRALNDHLARREQELLRTNEQLEARVAERTIELTHAGEELAHARQQVQDSDGRDRLTGLPDRRRADELLEDQLVQHRRHQRPFGVLLCRIDTFHPLGDESEEGLGDLRLQAVALAIRNTLRDSDTAARFAAEELLVLLPETDSDGLALAAEKVRAAVATLDVEGLARCTVSIGGAVTLVGSNLAAALLQRAEEALQAARAAGGDRVMVAGGAGAAPQPGWLRSTLPAAPGES